ncbi:MAG: hypothetical protein ABW088_17255 [Sedimenticola sp.]
MTSENLLVEQRIREYESRLKHLDEMIEKAAAGVGEAQPHDEINEAQPHDEIKAKLKQIRKERDKLESHYEQMKLTPGENWEVEEIEKSGPMGIWDVLAQDLEHLLKHLKL